MQDNSLNGPIQDPAHPGEILQYCYLEPLGLSIQEAAKGLGISRRALAQLINGYDNITPALAMRLAEAFNTTPQLWLDLQQRYDLNTEQRTGLPFIVTRFARDGRLP